MNTFYTKDLSIIILAAAACLAAAMAFHIYHILPIGFMSDDYMAVKLAKEGEDLWSLHYSPILQSLWTCTANGQFSSFEWRALALGLHWANAGIVFSLAKSCFQRSLPASLFAAALFVLNPAGIEAYAWTCSAGYVMTSTWILLGVYLLYYLDDSKCLLKELAIAAIQLLAFLTWDWGILILPIVLIHAFVRESSMKFLRAPALVWACGVILRAASKYSTGWYANPLSAKIKLALGAPMLGLVPQMDKEFYSSIAGVAIGGLILAILIRTALRNKIALALLLSFYISIAPWILGANPAGRYFYICMAFIYLTLAFSIDEFRIRNFARACMAVVLALESLWAYERADLWHAAYEESLDLLAKLKQIGSSDGRPVIIVNLPEAYGPEGMPMRPQLWHCGIKAVAPNVEVALTPGCAFVWGKREYLTDREAIPKKYAGWDIYEVVYQNKENWRKFDIVKFKD